MNYAKIIPCDIANGPGVRVTLFCTGCDHHCPGCQNPTTWDPNGGQPFTDETLDKIVDLLQPDYIQGLTLTGGDPLLPKNRETVEKICMRIYKEFRHKGIKKDIWMWTGYTFEELDKQSETDLVLMHILSFVNILVDGPFIEAEKDISLPYMGSKNQRVLDTWKSICECHPVYWWTPEKKGK